MTILSIYRNILKFLFRNIFHNKNQIIKIKIIYGTKYLDMIDLFYLVYFFKIQNLRIHCIIELILTNYAIYVFDIEFLRP